MTSILFIDTAECYTLLTYEQSKKKINNFLFENLKKIGGYWVGGLFNIFFLDIKHKKIDWIFKKVKGLTTEIAR